MRVGHRRDRHVCTGTPRSVRDEGSGNRRGTGRVHREPWGAVGVQWGPDVRRGVHWGSTVNRGVQWGYSGGTVGTRRESWGTVGV